MAFANLEEFKKRVVIALFSDADIMKTVVLKGGNLLDLAYGISPRPSQDIDLSIAGEFHDLERTRSIVERALTRTFAKDGHLVFDVTLQEEPASITEDLRDFWGGYRIEFKVIEKEVADGLHNDRESIRRRAARVRSDGGTKFPIEISKYEYCDGKEERLLDGCRIYAYTPAMLVCEKLRALCQQMPEYVQLVRRIGRPRGRDFLDIHTVAEYFRVDCGRDEFHNVVRKVFSAKRVPLRLLGLIGTRDVREFHRPDFFSVVDTVKPESNIQTYDYYYEYVVGKCQSLKPLWNE